VTGEPMFLTRLVFSTLFAAAGFAMVVTPGVVARQPAKDDLPKRPANYSEVSALKSAPSIPNLKKAQETFAAFSKYWADYISTPRVYTAPQEFIPPPPKGGEVIKTTDEIITEVSRH